MPISDIDATAKASSDEPRCYYVSTKGDAIIGITATNQAGQKRTDWD